MPTEIRGPAFALDVVTDPDEGVVRLRLTDEHGGHLGANQVRLAEHKEALWQGLFDTRSFVRTYANSVRFTDQPATAAELLDQIGVFLGETVLGSEILEKLCSGILHRSFPQLIELLARPDFEPLQRTLTEWNVGLDELQVAIDERVEEVRRGVEASRLGSAKGER